MHVPSESTASHIQSTVGSPFLLRLSFLRTFKGLIESSSDADVCITLISIEHVSARWNGFMDSTALVPSSGVKRSLESIERGRESIAIISPTRSADEMAWLSSSSSAAGAADSTTFSVSRELVVVLVASSSCVAGTTTTVPPSVVCLKKYCTGKKYYK